MSLTELHPKQARDLLWDVQGLGHMQNRFPNLVYRFHTQTESKADVLRCLLGEGTRCDHLSSEHRREWGSVCGHLNCMRLGSETPGAALGTCILSTTRPQPVSLFLYTTDV